MPARPRPRDLPDFGNPPVTEVALSIQFDSLTQFQNVHVGLLWQRFATEYPNVSEHPPIAPQFETFGMPARPQSAFQIETFMSPPMHRFWFAEEGGAHLVQVQQDRFLHNWRKREGGDSYPRYESVQDEFEHEVGKFSEFLEEGKLGALLINQCEATYINTIILPDGSNPHDNLGRITPLWTWKNETNYLSENTTIATRCIIREGDNQIGRVHVTFTPVVRNVDLVPAIQLEITARAKPDTQDQAAAFSLLDRARDCIVRMFAAVTTAEMHEMWERRDGKRR